MHSFSVDPSDDDVEGDEGDEGPASILELQSSSDTRDLLWYREG